MLKRNKVPGAAATTTATPVPAATPAAQSTVTTGAVSNNLATNNPNPNLVKSDLPPIKNSFPAYTTARAFQKAAQHKGYYSVRIDHKSSLAAFDQFGRAQACPKCCTSKITQPNLKLLYSTCCGRVLCSLCKDQVTVTPLTCDTPFCIGILNKETWSESPVDEYRYKRECQKRRELGKLAALVETDFQPGDKVTFDQYNEELQSLLYDYVYGNPPLVDDLGAVKSAMERTFAIQIQRHELEAQQRLAEQQRQFLDAQMGQQREHGAAYITMDGSDGGSLVNQAFPPHLQEIWAWHHHHLRFANNFPLEIYNPPKDVQKDESWERDWYQPHHAEIFSTFTEIPPAPATIEALQLADQAQNPSSNATTSAADLEKEYQRHHKLRQFEIHSRQKEEEYEMNVARMAASGLVDMSLTPITAQYWNAVSALEYENNYGIDDYSGAMGDEDLAGF